MEKGKEAWEARSSPWTFNGRSGPLSLNEPLGQIGVQGYLRRLLRRESQRLHESLGIAALRDARVRIWRPRKLV